MRRLLNAIVLIVAVALLGAGCTPALSTTTGLGDGNPTEDLYSAARRTLAASSFHVDTSYRAVPGDSSSGTIDYQAPGRLHERSGSGGKAQELILIGQDFYLSNGSGRFWLVAGKSAGPSPPLVWLNFTERAQKVRFDGTTYRFEVPPPTPGVDRQASATGEARIGDGFIQSLSYRLEMTTGEVLTLSFSFSAFNSGITIDPPPSASIVPDPRL